MCMCGMAWSSSVTRRHWLASTLAASGASLFGARPARAAEPSPAAAKLLASTITVDVHSHAAGMVFGAKMDDSLAIAMRAGGISAVCLAHVPDGPVIGRTPSGVLGMLRKPEPGALYKAHLERLDWIDRFVTRHGLVRVKSLPELQAAKARSDPALIQDIEGCDFLDGNLDRLDEAHARGARVIQLVHYIANDVGDFQTGPELHGGLTALGADAIRRLESLGVLVDVAHATEPTVRGAVKVAMRPLLLSHTAIAGSRAQGRTPLEGRQVSREHARMIADTGGVVGVWHFFPSLARMADGVAEMVDAVGVDHVGIGTDQQVARGALQDYSGYASLVDALLDRGFSPDEVAKIAGGNFVRVFGRATGAG